MKPSSVPERSRLRSEIASADFHDAWEAPLHDPDRSALEIYLTAVSNTPRWVDALMALRNRIVAVFGLKNLGTLGAIDRTRPAASYRPGERLGIFTILSIQDAELVLGDSDKHLRAQVSVYREGGASARVVASTVVHVHNALGRVYLFFVVPLHRRIVPAMLERIAGLR